MKTITRILAVSAICATVVSPAAAFFAFNDNAELFVTGTVGVRKDSNIFLSPSEVDDTILDFNPGLQLVFGNASVVKGSFSVSESFTSYTDHDDLNDELLSVGFNTNYDDGKSKLSFNGSFNELNQNTVDTLPVVGTVDGLIRRDVLAFGGRGEVSVTEKSSVAAGLQYNKADFKRSGFSDSQTVTLPVNYYYEMTAKVDLSLGYRYRQSWQAIGFDNKDHFLSIGARGEFTPKLSGDFSVGVTQRQFSHKVLRQEDKSLLGVDSTLTYAASPKTSIQFGVSNDFDTNSQGQQQKNFAVRASARSQISDQWSVTTGVSYRKIDYYSRVDDYYEAQIGATYTVSRNLDITGAFSLRSNNSDLPTSDFEGNVLSLVANFRF